MVVDRDKPSGVVLYANGVALSRRIFPGVRYAAGLALAGDLRGGVVSSGAVAEAVAGLTERLWRFSPRIEPHGLEPGVFWLDVSGMGILYPSLAGWAEAVCGDLKDAGYHAVAAVGFSRFGTYAAARSGRRNVVFESAAAEQAHVRRVPMGRLGVNPTLRDTLAKLGITTLGGFIDLPPGGVMARFGAEAAALHRFARGDGWAPLNPAALREAVVRRVDLEYAERSVERLVFRMAGVLQGLLGELAARHEVASAVEVRLWLDDGTVVEEGVSPAAPTGDGGALLGLVKLRLDGVALSAGVVGFGLGLAGVAASEDQLTLFADAPRENAAAAERAFARIRAEFGNDAVVWARLGEGHLPEARYGWEVLGHLPAPTGRKADLMPLVRRVYAPARELPGRARNEPDGWLVGTLADGPVEEVIGPMVVSGGWWVREVSRAYYYVRTRSGRWLWIYFDEKRRRWFLQGEIQ
ncbi:MAG: DNA polymerase [Candidatus Hydrogenedentota bacterium]